MVTAMASDAVKGFTLIQPWATAIALGWKLVESRSWGTAYRGRLAIHASKGYPPDARAFASYDRTAAPLLRQAGYGVTRALPLGAIVAIATLVDVKPTGGKLPLAAWVGELSEQEYALGDYSERRFGWFLEDVIALDQPIPCTGARGLWDVSPEIAALISEQIGATR